MTFGPGPFSQNPLSLARRFSQVWEAERTRDRGRDRSKLSCIDEGGKNVCPLSATSASAGRTPGLWPEGASPTRTCPTALSEQGQLARARFRVPQREVAGDLVMWRVEVHLGFGDLGEPAVTPTHLDVSGNRVFVTGPRVPDSR